MEWMNALLHKPVALKDKIDAAVLASQYKVSATQNLNVCILVRSNYMRVFLIYFTYILVISYQLVQNYSSLLLN